MKKNNIVIVGGGFGGIYAAKNLSRLLQPFIEKGEAHITLINKTNYFLFTPLLHEVATGGLSPRSVVEPIQEIFRKDDVEFIEDFVMTINPTLQQVSTSTRVIPYDYLVVSSGAETNFYGTVGAKENTITLKNLDDALIIRKRILERCAAASLTQDLEERKKLLSFIIVGAGPTGVETAAEIVEFMHETLCAYYKMCGVEKNQMKISLVAASPDVLPMFPVELRAIAQAELIRKGVHVMTNEQVVEVSATNGLGKITFADKSFLEAGTIIWVAGVKPISPDIVGAEKEKNGRLKLDPFLQVIGAKNIFSLGDVSGTAPMLAQVAVQQGKIVAQNISATIFSQPLTPFVFHEKGLLVSLGQWYAAGRIYGVVLKGPLMWFVWRTVYLLNFNSWRKRIEIAVEWTLNLFTPRNITMDINND